jgi:hypothetical protein
MKYKFLYTAIFYTIVVGVPFLLSSDAEIFFSPSPYFTTQEQQESFSSSLSSSAQSTKKYYIKRDKFIYLVSDKFAFTEEKLQKLYSQGYGYKELIKLLYISSMGGVEFDSVVKLRSSGEKLRNISKRYNVDYSKVVESTDKMYCEIKSELLSLPTSFFESLPPLQEEEDLQGATTEEYRNKYK